MEWHEEIFYETPEQDRLVGGLRRSMNQGRELWD